MRRLHGTLALGALLAALIPLPSAAQTASAPPQAGGALKVDPCAMLSAPDIGSALGTGARTVGTPWRPSPNECAWAVASHAGAPAQNVLLVMQPVAAAAAPAPCRGLGCIGFVQSLSGTHLVPSLPPAFSDAFADAQLIAGLGDRASWKDGRLTVVRADMAFQLLVRGPTSPALNTSEALARDVLYRIATP